MGILSIFRINFLGDNIRNSFDRLDKALRSHMADIAKHAPREKFNLIISYFSKPDEIKRSNFEKVDPIIHDILNQMWHRVLIIRCFTVLLAICGILFATFLCLSWPSVTTSKILYYLIIVAVGLIFIFAGIVVWTTTNWKYWKGVKKRWQDVKNNYT